MADQQSPRVLMSGAGTGGHLYPGIAVAQEIRRRHPRSEVVFAGTGRDLEVRALDRLGFDLVRVHSAGLKVVLGTPTATPPKWLVPGDVVEMEITQIGLLRNTVASE